MLIAKKSQKLKLGSENSRVCGRRKRCVLEGVNSSQKYVKRNAKCEIRGVIWCQIRKRSTYQRIRVVEKYWKTNWKCFSVWCRFVWTDRTRSLVWAASVSFATDWKSSIRRRMHRLHRSGVTAYCCWGWIRWHSCAYWWAEILGQRGRIGRRLRSLAIHRSRAVRRRFVVWGFSGPDGKVY